MVSSFHSRLSIYNSKFTNLVALENSGILFSYSSWIEIESSTFDTFSHGGISTDTAFEIKII